MERFTWSPLGSDRNQCEAPGVINMCSFWLLVSQPWLHWGSESHFCELNQGEVCGLAVFPHADVWGRAGSIFRICPSFFQEPPLSAPSNQAAEANASGIRREGWTEAVTQKVGLKKLTWQRYLIVWGQWREHAVRERNLGKQTCGVAPITFQTQAAYRRGF